MKTTRSFRVTLWEHNWLETTVIATSEAEAIEQAQHRYAGATPTRCECFELLDAYSDDWDVRLAPAALRSRRRP